MRTLLLDIETAPNLAYCWGIWEQNININHMVNSSYVLCWSAKWLGDKDVKFRSVQHGTHRQMLTPIHHLLDEADVVVHYNGRSFDVPTLNKEFLLANMAPPSPYKQIDMLKVARAKFRFQSNKLDYVAQQLGLGEKTAHEGFGLWVKCMEKDPTAWKKMEQYNKNDVVLLEKVYNKMLPWIPNHPNVGLYDGKDSCPTCGSMKVQRRGVAVSKSATYQRFQCLGCGVWFKGGQDKSHVKSKFSGIV